MTKKQLPFYLCFFITTLLHAQDVQQNFLDSLSGKFITHIRKQGRPKAFLATDKSIFKPGENIWLRGFLLNSVSQKVTSQSNYLFVDLVNDKDSVVSFILLNAASQQLNAKITLPDELPGGYYWLRAYTRQMAEGDSSNAFIKPVYVIGTKGKRAAFNNSKATAGTDPIIKFYPEGGNIITGVNSTVALLVSDPKGKPLATEGYIKDTRDSIIARFASDRAGLGKFTISASSFRRYKAYINWNGKEIAYPLPSFNFFAGQISVTRQAGGNNVLRVLLEDSIYKKNIVSYVIGISKDSLCFAAIGHGQYEMTVPDQRFPQGIATFYLFDNNGKLLSERSIYIKESNVIVKTVVDKNIYSKREKATLSLSVTDANQKPVPSLVSVSVADTAFTNPASENELPDLNNPAAIDNFALARLNSLPDDYLDLMMLLKNNTYEDRNSNLVRNTSDDNDSVLFIRGKALDEKNKPASNKILTLFSTASSTAFLTDTTDNSGQFSFPIFDYADSTEFAIQARNINTTTSTNVKILRDPPSFPQFSTPISLKKYPADPVLNSRSRNAYVETPLGADKEGLKGVVVTTKKKASFNEGLRVSPNSTVIAGDQLDERRTTGDLVLNAGGLHVVNGVLIINGLTSMRGPDATSEPLLLIDGSEAPPGAAGESRVLSVLNGINPKEIDFIEILKGPEGANYGLRGGNGVILVNMAHESRRNFSSNSGNVQTFYAKGISKPSAFPTINYDKKEIKSSEVYDNRSTIFWNGSVLTGTENNYNLSFFTNDIPTTYQVTVTGITVHGDLIYKTIFFNSK